MPSQQHKAASNGHQLVSASKGKWQLCTMAAHRPAVKYNARNIKRTIDRELRLPMARLLGSGQIMGDEGVLVDYIDDKYTFRALPQTNNNFVLHGSATDMGDLL